VGIIETAISPWGQTIPIHAAFWLLWVSAIGGLVFLVVHSVWLMYFAKPEEFEGHTSPAEAAKLPEKIKRHSVTARLFHLVQSIAMLTLLFTAFLPKVGVEFAWVKWHWMAGIVLGVSILFHIIHASFVMDFWAIWPDKIDIEDAFRRLKRFRGENAPPPRRFAKYPLENKMYHLAVLVCGLTVTLTGSFMIFRVRTPFFTRNPYVLSDMSIGMMYAMHGLAGIALIGMIIIHVYFALHPRKFPITKGMLYGVIDKDHYIHHHDPERWAAESAD
jgi:cytochrome b subunit of formate dehydrogenase